MILFCLFLIIPFIIYLIAIGFVLRRWLKGYHLQTPKQRRENMAIVISGSIVCVGILILWICCYTGTGLGR